MVVGDVKELSTCERFTERSFLIEVVSLSDTGVELFDDEKGDVVINCETLLLVFVTSPLSAGVGDICTGDKPKNFVSLIPPRAGVISVDIVGLEMGESGGDFLDPDFVAGC